MKSIVLSIFVFLLTAPVMQAGLFQFGSPEIAAVWKKITPKKEKQLRSNFIKAGLNLVGQLTVTEIYILTYQEAIGSEGDRVALVVQDKLKTYHGNRLFAVYMVNLNTAKVLRLYSSEKIETDS